MSKELTIGEIAALVKTPEELKEIELKENFDWVVYRTMLSKVGKGEILKEIHVFNGIKKYGFLKDENNS